ncbi:hypothetical protein CAL65_13295 [Alkalilimnicola ehrlichii]|uniref:DUF3739 domain-containing protein n=3 Tax=Alkalilimnicola ehrlichii TaxID=351052 RepID=A0A3E0WQ50_9GAMM|nr:hypothetical protein CAL65_13295 [Alkalilimnicola ehrlichii]
MHLRAGRDHHDSRSRFDLNARTDLWNNTAAPIRTNPRAEIELMQDNRVRTANNSVVASVGDVYLVADEGIRRLSGRGTGKDLYREGAEGLGNVISGLVGGGEVSFAIETGNTHFGGTHVVTVDGDVRTSIRNEQLLHLDYRIEDGELIIFASSQSEGVEFEVSDTSLTQQIMERLDELYTYLVDYSGSQLEEAAFQAEINLLEMRLVELAEQAGLEIEYIDGRPNVPDEIPIKMITVEPIIAQSGNIHVFGDALVGSGTLEAPGDSLIDIVNDTPGFLAVGDLKIPTAEGGQLIFNRTVMEGDTTAELNQSIRHLNRSGLGNANFGEVITAESGPLPQINIRTPYEPSPLTVGGETGQFLAPDIYLRGDVRNLRGNVVVSNAAGSIYVDGNIRAYNSEIGAGRDFILTYQDGFRHIGNDPRTGTGGAPRVAGGNIVASARYLNINGLMQTGVAEWNLDVSDELIDSRIAIFELLGLGRPRGVHRMAATDPVTGQIGWSFDFDNNQIIVHPIEVDGGYMELTGQIMNTGGGQLKAIDGYGKINIANNTNYELLTQNLNAGEGIQGRIRLNDSAFSNDDTLRSTIYVMDGGEIKVYQGAYSRIRETDEFLLRTTEGRETTYSPRSGQDYVWVVGTTSEHRRQVIRYSDTAIGFIPSGSGTVHYDEEWQLSSAPIDGAEYVYIGRLPEGGIVFTNPITGDDIVFLPPRDELAPGQGHEVVDNIETEDPELTSRRNWTSCETRIIWCVETRQWQEDIYQWGERTYTRNTIRADYKIDIGFIGFDEGVINIDSVGDVTVTDNIRNVSGHVDIIGNRIEQRGESTSITGRTIDLKAEEGIGTRRELRLAADSVSATSTSGDIALDAFNGDLTLRQLDAQDGDVRLSAQRDIGTIGNAVIRGEAISLDARTGRIGTANRAVRIDTADNDNGLFNASAAQGVHVREVNGSLRVVQIDAGRADVSITVDDGDLIDANTEARRDERRLAELERLWEEMGLTGDAAQASLEQEKAAQEAAGETRYQRYWNLRNLSLDDNGNVVADAYDPDYQASLSAAQRTHLQEQLGWDEARITDYQKSLTAEYHDLHQEFGHLGGYDENFRYALSADQIAELERGAEWSVDQLRYSVSAGLLDQGTGGGVEIEAPNVIAGNVTLSARNIGRTLAEDVIIDVSDGFEGLTQEQRIALGTAERGDVFEDPENENVVRIVQRDAFIIDNTGSVTATADEDIFLGGRNNLNLYNVSGGAVRLSADGDITTLRPGETVLSGRDVILEAPNGSIGSLTNPLQTNISGVLTTRGAGTMNLHQVGDLRIDQVYGSTGVNLTVDGNLLSDREAGASLRGGWIDLNVAGNVGTENRLVNVELGADSSERLSMDIGGDAFIGAEQGVFATPGNLRFGDVAVGGDLAVSDVISLDFGGEASIGGTLTATLANAWTMGDDARLEVGERLTVEAGGEANLREVAVNGSDAHAVSIDASRINGVNGAAYHLRSNGTANLTAHDAIGSADERLLLDVRRINAFSDAGAVGLHLQGPVAGGNLTALADQVWLSGAGDIALTSIFGRDGVTAEVDGALAIGRLTSEGAAYIEAATLALDHGIADDEFVVRTNGQQTLGDIEAGGRMQLSASNGGIRFAALHGGEDLLLEAAGQVEAVVDARLDEPRPGVDRGVMLFRDTVVLNGGGDMNLGWVRSAEDRIVVDTAGTFAAQWLDTPMADILIHAGAADLGGAHAYSHVLVDTTADPADTDPRDWATFGQREGADIRFADLRSETGDVLVYAGGDVHGGDAVAYRDLILAGRNLTLGRTESLTRDLEFQALENILGQRAVSARDITIGAGGDLLFESVDYEGDISLSAGRNIWVRVGGDIDMERVEAGENVELFADGGIALVSVDAGGVVTLEAGEALRVEEYIRAGGNVTASGEQVVLDTVTAGGRSISTRAARSTCVGSTAMGGKICLPVPIYVSRR